MRILYHHRTLGDGAEGIHIAEMIRALQALGHEVELVGPALTEKESTNGHPHSQESSASLAAIKRALPEVGVRAAEITYNIKSYTDVSRAIRHFQPDFIYERYSCFSCGGIKAARKHRVPLLLEVNATFTGKWGARHKLYFDRIARQLETYALMNSTGIATVSTPLKQSIVDAGIDDEKVIITPNAIDPDRVRQAYERSAGSSIRRQYGLGDGPVIGFVGSFRRWHGIELLINSASAVLREFPNARYFIVGFGELEEELCQLARHHGLSHAIVFPGRIAHDRVLDHIDAMDIAVMPNSNQFGSPMKVFEYMGMGKAVIAPRLGPLEDVIQHEQTGILTTPGSQDELNAALLGLLANRDIRQRLGSCAKSYVLRERTWTRNASSVVSLFSQLGATEAE